MRCHVAFTPAEAPRAQLGIVVDVMRATSTIAQALAAGYRRVLCCAEIDDALALRAELGEEAITGGEREAKRIEGFDAGASPREFREPRAETLILSTTNGTRSIVAAAASCDEAGAGPREPALCGAEGGGADAGEQPDGCSRLEEPAAGAPDARAERDHRLRPARLDEQRAPRRERRLIRRGAVRVRQRRDA